VPGGAGPGTQDCPVQWLNVSAIQNVGLSARTRRTTWFESVPRTAVLRGPAKPKKPPTRVAPSAVAAWTGSWPLAPPTSPLGVAIGTSPARSDGKITVVEAWGAGSTATTTAEATTTPSRAMTPVCTRTGEPPAIEPHMAMSPARQQQPQTRT